MSKITKTESQILDNEDYKNLLQELKSILQKGQHQAYKAVDNIRVQTYWQLGERIVREELKNKDRAEYEKYLIDNLVGDLNIRRRLLYEIVKFYRVYPIVHAVCAQLSWSHYGFLTQIDDEKERFFYQNKTVIHSWSVRELREQIKSRLYQKTESKEIEETLKTTLPEVVDIQRVFKPDYDLQFIQIADNAQEKELEK